MSIRFIANDPQSGFNDERIIEPHQDRVAGRATFQFFDAVPEEVFDLGTDGFLFWQCREAALRGLDTWEAITGNLDRWFGNQPRLDLIQKGPGNTANAFYNRRSLKFFEFQTAARTYLSGASTDVVAHELGHACLDAIRPELFNTLFMEPGALHEAFGDIVAILTALSDQDTRTRLLQDAQDLQGPNFVEATAEDLSDGIRQGIEEGLIPNSVRNAAAPRRASNTFQWALPLDLPTTGEPGALINEIHSFGQIFSGCIYDVIANIFQSAPQQNEASLLDAAQTTGTLLVAACRNATVEPRFFKSVGEAMVVADREQNGGQNVDAIERAYSGHGIDLEPDAMLMPTETLSGRAPALAATTGAGIITRASRRDIVNAVGKAEGQQFSVRPAHVAETDVAVARHRFYVPLDDVARGLEGVEAPVEEDILIGEDAGRAAILGVVPAVQETQSEVQRFVRSLVDNESIDMGDGAEDLTTHRIEKAGKRKVLRRVRFSCTQAGCHTESFRHRLR